MCFTKKKKQSEFFIEDPAEQRFDAMMELVKDLSKRDYNRLKEAMDLGYTAYQKVRNIDNSDDTQAIEADFMLHPEEGK